MTRTISQAREAAGIEVPLKGEALKDFLEAGKVKFLVVGVSMDDTDYGAQWCIKIKEHTKNTLPDNSSNTLWFSVGEHIPDAPSAADRRDADFTAMGDATPDDPIGPCIFARKGSRGFGVIEDAS